MLSKKYIFSNIFITLEILYGRTYKDKSTRHTCIHTHTYTYHGSCSRQHHYFHEAPGKLVQAVEGIGVGRAGKAETHRHAGPRNDVVMSLAEGNKLFFIISHGGTQ